MCLISICFEQDRLLHMYTYLLVVLCKFMSNVNLKHALRKTSSIEIFNNLSEKWTPTFLNQYNLKGVTVAYC